MTSTAQVQANRANAQKSTGPRTPEGKAVAAQNAVRHGLLAQEVVVKGEDPGEFECYREQMLAELAPVGLLEERLAQRIVGLSWRLRRAERLQTAAYDKIENTSEQPEPTMSPEDAAWLIARMLERGLTYQDLAGSPLDRRAVQDFNQERVLDRLLVYERRIEHSLYRTMAELRKERSLRQAAGGLPRSTGILPVRSMGAGSQTQDSAFGVPVPPMTVPETHGQDARDTHGRDAHATKAEGGTPNGDQSCQTNPMCGGVLSVKSEVAGGDPVLPTSPLPLETSDNPPEGGNPSKACETNPIPEPDSAPKKTPPEPRPARMYPNTAREMTYDSFLGRWVWTGAALAGKDANQADWGRRP